MQSGDQQYEPLSLFSLFSSVIKFNINLISVVSALTECRSTHLVESGVSVSSRWQASQTGRKVPETHIAVLRL